jgi:hypothetical protein
MTDAYDFLCNMAQLDGVRISPLFRVFWSVQGWRVCGTNLEGDPLFTHEIHPELRPAFDQANQLNAENGCPAITLNRTQPAA